MVVSKIRDVNEVLNGSFIGSILVCVIDVEVVLIVS